MNEGFSLRDAMTDVVNNMAASMTDFIPRAVTALVIIIFGLIVAKIAERVLRTMFDKLRFDDLLERVGLRDTLRKVGFTDRPARIVSRTAYFLLVVLFVQSVTRAVELNTIADAISAFFAYLPSLLSAFLVLLLGTMVAQFVSRAVTRAATDSGIDTAPLLGRLLSGLIMFVVGIMAVSQLRVDTEIIRTVVTVLLAGFALALSLSFGLGTRDVTRNIVAGFYARKLFEAGSTIEIQGQKGTLSAITQIQTLIEVDGETRAIPNKVFLEEVVKQ